MRTRVLLVAAAVAIAVVVGAVILRPTDSAPPGPSAALDARGPVLLIPGYGGGTAGFSELTKSLSDAGVASETLATGDGTGDLSSYASLVVDRAQQLVEAGAPSVDLVGFSAGGLIARDAATRASGRPLIRKVVTIGSPHAGTKLASLGALVGECPTACQQLTPGSDYLDALPPADDTDRWVSIWSTSDEVVRPADSAALDGARWFRLQDVCAREVAHNDLTRDPLVVSTARDFLAGTPLPTGCVG